ncbi:MAG: hypothetical protein K1X49_13410 [Saprospiraceae bacterium]|nr:hypothetical protein [Saprospiraceae bacterium]
MEVEVRRLLDNQDWDTMVKKLTLHAYSRFKFWGLLKQKALKGYSPQDIALEAISLVYSGEWSWDPAKSDLLTYLKFHVVNGLVANLAKNKEILTTEVDDGVEAENDYSIEDELNARLTIEGIRETLNNDLLLKIFDQLLIGMKRIEIIQKLDISSSDYDNALKRLKARILKWKTMTIAK